MMMRLVAAALVLGSAGVLASAPDAGQFRSGVDNVVVDVSVFAGKRAVLTLGAADFEVSDNGVRQKLSGAHRNNLPLDVRLLFDTSGSITPEDLERYRRAMERVAMALRPEDRVEILAFNGRVTEVLPLRHPPVKITLTRQGRDGTAFFDAISLAMVTRPLLDRRQVTIVLTDAQDNASFFDKDTLYAAAQRTHAVVYGVLPTGLAEDASRFSARLEMLTRVTGGDLVRSKWDSKMGDVLVGMLNEFRQGYVLTYALDGVPSQGWHKLIVRVPGGRGLKVRAREGYFAR